jgi:hypothetical protein
MPNRVLAQDRTITIHFVDQYGEPYPDGTLTFDWGRRTAGSFWPIRCVSGYLTVYNSSITYQLPDNMYWYGPCVTGGIGDQIGAFEDVPTSEMPDEFTMTVIRPETPEPTLVPTDVPTTVPVPTATVIPTSAPEPTATGEATIAPSPPPTQIPLPIDELIQQIIAILTAILAQQAGSGG